MNDSVVASLERQARAFNRDGDYRSESVVKQLIDIVRKQNRATADTPSVQSGEAVAIYHGDGIIDCGDRGHHNLELLKLIPAGTKLYRHPQPALSDSAELALQKAGSNALNNALVDFTAAMAARLQEKSSAGWDGWQQAFHHQIPDRMMRKCARVITQQIKVAPKDLVDIANFAMFMHRFVVAYAAQPITDTDQRVEK